MKCLYLKVFLSVEYDGLGFHFTILDVYFVATEDDRDVFTDSDQISVPVGYILVRDSGSYIKHDDGTLTL